MKFLPCIIIAGTLLCPLSEAEAQCSGVFGANQVCASLLGGPPGPVNSTALPAGLIVGTTTITGGNSHGVLYNNSGVLGADSGLTWTLGGPLTINPTGGNMALSAQFFDANSGVDILMLPAGAPGSYSAPHAISGTNRYGPTADSSDNPDGIYGILWYTTAHNFTGAGAALRGNAYTVPVITATIAAGGANNQIGDILTIVGGTCNTDLNVPPTFAVSGVSVGAVTSVTYSNQSACTVYPGNPVTTTSSNGSATPPTLNLTVASSPNVTNLIGAYGRARHTSKGTVTNAIALQGDGCYNAGGGTLTNCMAMWLQTPYDTPTNSYGAYFAGTFNQGSLAYANGSTFSLTQVGGGTSQLNIRRLDNGGAGNNVAQLVFQGQNATPTTVNYAYWNGFANVVTAGIESGTIYGHTLRAGVDTNEISIGGGIGVGTSGTVNGVGTLTVDSTAFIGTAGSVRGTLTMAGNTSGTQVWQPAAAASGTITWPAGTVNFSATGGANQVVKQTSLGGIFTVAQVTAAEIGSGAALTKVDDTNVTLTLGGTPASALLAATSLTLGWTGQLGLSRGGTNNSPTASNGGIVWSDATKINIATAFTGLVLATSGATPAAYAGTSCTNQFVRSLNASGAATCATVGSADVSLANLTATDSTLTFSGTYNGSTARTIGLNLGNANTWTATQTMNGTASTYALALVAQANYFQMTMRVTTNPRQFWTGDSSGNYYFDTNRETTSGTFDDSNKTHVRIASIIGSGTGQIQLFATNTNATQAQTGFVLFGSGGASLGNSGADAGLGAFVMILHSTSKGATITATAPGAGNGALIFACGTNAGTAGLYAGAGTSTTYTRVLDNIGASVTGC